MKKTTNQFKKDVFELEGNNYLVIGEYEGARVKIKMKHNHCGYEYTVTPSNFLNGRRCPKCSGRIKNKTTDYFKKEVFTLTNGEYELLGEYVNAQTKTAIKHNKCGNAFNMKPNNFISGQRCPYCGILSRIEKQSKTTKQYKDEVYSLVGNEYEVLGEYVNNHTKILMIHVKCGNEFETVPHAFSDGNRCPICAESKGEQRIRHWLENNNIKFEYQYRFEDCKSKRSLPFDFAVFNNKNELMLLIEYDGEQHFEPMRYSKNKEKMIAKLKQTQLHDQIKNEYCKQNNIQLLRVPHWKFDNIETILEKELTNVHKLNNEGR